MFYLTDYLIRNAADYADKPAINFEGTEISWEELWQKVDSLSGFFESQLDNHAQQVVAILMTNSIDFVVIYLAVVHSGHIALPLDPAYKKLEIDAIIGQLSPSLLITSQRYLDKINPKNSNTFLFEDLKPVRQKARKLLRTDAKEQIASLTFTSGTSGRPKAVPNTHANHIWNIEVCSKVWDWTSQDTMLLNLPLSHWYGLVMGLTGAIYHGNTIYLHQQSFDPGTVLKELSSGKISFFTHVPLAYIQMLDHEGSSLDLSAVRLCVSGGAALPTAVWHSFKDKYGIEIVETYGSSETGRIAANNLGKKMPGSPGQVLPGVDLRLSPQGEVLIKSPGVFPGYYHNLSATRAATTSDGYWRTGDLAELKNDYVYLKGRVQEQIRRYGYTVSPRDVEWAMHQHPKIQDIYVLGRQRPGNPNDELIYFIVGSISDAEIEEFSKENLLFAWRPDKIINLSELPRTRSGKPKIAKLKVLAG